MARDSAGRPIRYRKWQNDGVSRYRYVATRVRRERQRTWVWNEEQGEAKRSAEWETFNMSEINGTEKTGAAEDIVRRWLFGGPYRESKRPRGRGLSQPSRGHRRRNRPLEPAQARSWS